MPPKINIISVRNIKNIYTGDEFLNPQLKERWQSVLSLGSQKLKRDKPHMKLQVCWWSRSGVMAQWEKKIILKIVKFFCTVTSVELFCLQGDESADQGTSQMKFINMIPYKRMINDTGILLLGFFHLCFDKFHLLILNLFSSCKFPFFQLCSKYWTAGLDRNSDSL